MKKAVLLSTLVVCGSLAACVISPRSPPAPVQYTKPGATQQEFMQDLNECIRAAQPPYTGVTADQSGVPPPSGSVTSCSVLIACMGARGYLNDPEGALEPPRGKSLKCR